MARMKVRNLALVFLASVVPAWCAVADEISFEQSVGPIFAARCVTCHNEQKTEGGLSLATSGGALGESDSGQVIVPGAPDDSILLDYVTGKEPEMPLFPLDRFVVAPTAT